MMVVVAALAPHQLSQLQITLLILEGAKFQMSVAVTAIPVFYWMEALLVQLSSVSEIMSFISW
jgi:hypothetical protein